MIYNAVSVVCWLISNLGSTILCVMKTMVNELIRGETHESDEFNQVRYTD